MANLLLLLAALSFSANANEKHSLAPFDCTAKTENAKLRALCKKIIDPIKAKNGECARIDCTAELEDGYTVGICTRVNLTRQHALKKTCSKISP